ncbi:MAG TPA: HIT domain-containing protein [bacterium]|nr:HIT domain-containing protein [bacterium]
MADCLFCTLIGNAKPGFLVHDKDGIVAFRDIHPQAPTHILVVPREHFSDLTAMEGRTDVVGRMYAAAIALAKSEKIDDGFRSVLNCKEKGGQSVFHVHMHLLGGKAMGPSLTG